MVAFLTPCRYGSGIGPLTQAMPEPVVRIIEQTGCARMRTAISAVLLAFTVTSACADATNGERLAQRWCAPCHAASGQGGSAPALPAIARNGWFSRDRLAIFILLFHPTMPDTTLTRDEAVDLAEYIATLSKVPNN